MPATTPYGSWTSPISAADLTTNGHPVSGPRWVGDEVWWLELRPQEDGRSAVRRRDASGAVVDVLPAPWNAASRVHEYGGGAWAADDRGVLVFVEFTDQRLYVLEPGAPEPRPLTPLGIDGTHHRYGDVSLRGDEVVAVRETHTPSATKTGENTTDIVRDVVAVPVDGSAATDPAAVRSVVGGSDFLAAPRWSPDGRHLVWIAWDHPRMPWDGTELRVAPVDDDGVAGTWRTLAGSPTESVLQPEWLDDDTLVAIADPTGWWNLERITLDGVRTPLHPDAAEYGGPLWRLGTRWYTLLPDGRLLATRTFGSTSLVVLDPSGQRDPEPIETPWTSMAVGEARDGRVLVTSGASTVGAGARVLDLATGAAEDVRLDADDLPDARYLPVAERREFPGERTVHAIVYPPRNPDHVAPQGELPRTSRSCTAVRPRRRWPRSTCASRTGRAAGSGWSTSTTAGRPGTAAPTARPCGASGASSTSRTRSPRCGVSGRPGSPIRHASRSAAARPAAGRSCPHSPGPTCSPPGSRTSGSRSSSGSRRTPTTSSRATSTGSSGPCRRPRRCTASAPPARRRPAPHARAPAPGPRRPGRAAVAGRAVP